MFMENATNSAWSVVMALPYLKATPVGLAQLQFLKENVSSIRVSRTDYLRWEAWREDKPNETWISSAFGVTFQTGKYKGNVCDVCIASDNLNDPIDAAATLVHELEHAREKITGAEITEGDARVAEMTFYLQSGELGLAKLMKYYGDNLRNYINSYVVNVKAVLTAFNQQTVVDPLEYGPAQFGSWVDITRDLLK